MRKLASLLVLVVLPLMPQGANVAVRTRIDNESYGRMSRTGLNNLMAMARLFHSVRMNHPSDQARDADWFGLALSGVITLDYATQPASLGRRMYEIFAPFAPTLAIYTGTEPAFPARRGEIISYVAPGGWLRATAPARALTKADFEYLDLNRGLEARVPRVVFLDKGRTQPLVPDRWKAPEGTRDLQYRPVRLAILILAWSQLLPLSQLSDDHPDRHFALARALTEVAGSMSPEYFQKSLQTMAAELNPTPTTLQLPLDVVLKPPF